MENSVSIFDSKATELIAIGSSIAGNCLTCLRYLFAEAIKLGASLDEIQEAIQIGRMFKERLVNDI